MAIDGIALSLIVARSRNHVIGRDGTMPWRLKDDLQSFKRLTLGKPMLMGRKTWDSLPRRPLPGRNHIVLTQSTDFRVHGAWTCSDYRAARALAIAQAKLAGQSEICIIGGASLYALALPEADRIYLTEIHADIAGDTFFPALSEHWHEVARTDFGANADNDHPFSIRILER